METASPVGSVLRDPVSALTHLASAVLGAYVTLLLWRLTRHERRKRASLAVFGVSMVLLYAASGTYHAISLPQPSPTIDYFRRLDHSAIYGLIAGTYTPVFAVLLTDSWTRRLLPFIWGLAVLGIAAKWLLPAAPDALAVALYLGLGWIGVVLGGPLARTVGRVGVFWGALGGILYTVGAVCELARWPTLLPGWFGPHELFHVCVMGGTAAHVAFMFRCVVPFSPNRGLPVRRITTDGGRKADAPPSLTSTSR